VCIAGDTGAALKHTEDRLRVGDVERIGLGFAAVVAGERKAVELRRW